MSKFAEAVRVAEFSDPDSIIALERIGILAESTGPATEAAPGTSRLGGDPDLPESIAWPTWNEKPLAFIAQINLADLPKIPDRALLPKKGMLYFFFAIEDETGDVILEITDRDCQKVLYADVPATALRRVPRPVKSSSPAGRTRKGAQKSSGTSLSFRPLETLPEPSDDAAALAAPLNEEDRSRLADFIFKQYSHPLFRGEPATVHQILGYPLAANIGSVPDNICLEAVPEYEDLSDEEQLREQLEWELLLQVDSEGSMSWGDLGRIYFMIRRKDLKARRFDKTWLYMMCS